MDNKNNDAMSGLFKAFLITIGVFVSIFSVFFVLFRLFKKYFKITFECGDCDTCDSINCKDNPECCFCDDDKSNEVEVEEE